MTAPIPRYHQFFNPVLRALVALGGSGTIDEIVEKTIQLMVLPPDVAEATHGDSDQSEVGYRIAWARSYLKKTGLLENSQRGVWTLTELGRKTKTVDPDEIRKLVRGTRARKGASTAPDVPPEGLGELGDVAPDDQAADWQSDLLGILRAMDPIAFERLCQRLLRESGFIEVEVTRRSADGGIDGRGILRLNGLISFTVMFQSKRYADAVGASVVRDFRGALMGRADKGLIITTGRFTHEASKEATRDGATPIDLIDGKLLVLKLKELGLGVTTRTVEVVEVDAGWFGRV